MVNEVCRLERQDSDYISNDLQEIVGPAPSGIGLRHDGGAKEGGNRSSSQDTALSNGGQEYLEESLVERMFLVGGYDYTAQTEPDSSWSELN